MDVSRRLTIGVKEEGRALAGNPLFAALTSLFPAEFRPWTNGDCHGLDALIVSGVDPATVTRIASTGLPIFASVAPGSAQDSTGPARMCLGKSPNLTAALRGYCFDEQGVVSGEALPALAGDAVLASQEDKPIWLRRQAEGTDVTMVRWPLPCFGPEDHVYEHFRAGRFLRLLPLLQFLRNMTRQADWQSPPTPACLLIDDPNLHSKTYGRLDYRRLAKDAREQDFYVSIATVPLDCWWLDREAMELFRENAPRISIVVHGNNHTSEELAQAASEVENLSVLAQALRRCGRLQQQQSGIEFCRVMECPHGSLSVAMLEPMARLGYEAVFATTAHLLRCNRGTTFRASLGGERTLLRGRAVPIIPRIRANDGWQTEVRLAAFLNRPIILAAHHWDFADRSHLVDEFTQLVNSLPDVKWASPTGVSRGCYQFRQLGNALHIRLGSRLVDVPVAPCVEWIVIHRPWLEGAEQSELLAVRVGEAELLRVASSEDVVGPIPVQGGTNLQISSFLLNRVDCESVPTPRFQWWPLVRKLMVEVRDRSCVPVHLRS